MPQLDKLTYSTQIFWLLISFTSFYFIILKNILPSILLNIKTRETITNDMLSGNSSASTEVGKVNTYFVQINANVAENLRKVLSRITSEINAAQENVNRLHQIANQKASIEFRNLHATKEIIKKL